MRPEDIQKLQEMIDDAGGVDPWLIVVIVAIGLAAGYFGTYLKEKGKNTATKEDIAEVTRKIEEVKIEMSEKDRISTVKYEHKREACLRMLTIVDAHLSHTVKTDKDGKKVAADKQYADIESARKCHNDLLLSVDNQLIVEKFLSILLGKASKPVQTLDELRLEIRKEMGYDGNPHRDTDATWIAVLSCKDEA